MQAARINEGQLTIEDVEVPEPGFEQARVRIDTAGVCHSDLHLARGEWHGVNVSVCGHEAIGVVEELGEGAERFISVGDRVILGLGGTGGGYWCGACIHCLGGEPRLCAQGAGIMGTFAEQFCVYAKSLVVVPESVGDEEAPLACGGLTAYGAVKKLFKHHINPGSTIADHRGGRRVGSLRRPAGQELRLRGHRRRPGRGAAGLRQGAGSRSGHGAGGSRRASGGQGGVDAVLIFAAAKPGFDLGIKMLRRGGLFVAVGIPADRARATSRSARGTSSARASR